MKWQRGYQSSNVEDRRGSGGRDQEYDEQTQHAGLAKVASRDMPQSARQRINRASMGSDTAWRG